jgi:hypothetical protein
MDLPSMSNNVVMPYFKLLAQGLEVSSAQLLHTIN